MEDDDPQNPRRHNTWRIRSPTEAFVAENVYGGYDNLFTLKLYYGGIFTKAPRRRYVDGKVSYVDYCNIDEFSVHEIDFMVRDLKIYIPDVEIYYHFQIPGQDLDIGLTPLGNDADVLCLGKYVAANKVIRLFIEHGFTRIPDYLSPPKSTSVVIEQLEDAGPNIPRKKLKVAKKLRLGEGSSEPNSRVEVSNQNVEVRVNGIEDIDKRMQVQGNMVSVEGNVGSLHDNVGSLEGNVAGHEGAGVNDGAGVNEVNVGSEQGNVCIVEGNVGTVNEGNIYEPDIENADFSTDFPVDNTDNQHGHEPDNEVEAECEHEGSCDGESECEHEGSCDGESESEEDEDDDSEDSDFKADLDFMMEDAAVDMRDYYENVDHGEEFMGPVNESVGNNDGNDNDDDPLAGENLNYDSLDSLTEDSAGELRCRRHKKLKELKKKKRGENTTSKVRFYVGQMFGTAKEAKDLINKHAIETRRAISFIRNDKKRLRVVCEGKVPVFTTGPINTGPNSGPDSGPGNANVMTSGPINSSGSSGKKKGIGLCNDKRKARLNSVSCPWVLYLSKLDEDDETWVVKTYKPDHKCLQSRKIQPFTSTFLAQQQWVLNQIESNPNIPLRSIQEELGRKYELGVSKMKAFRAKLKASKALQGDFNEQYSSLRDYAMELMRTNPGTTVKFAVEPCGNPSAPTRIFKRVYICLGPLKQGYKECRRDFLGLDGAFMKGPYPGQMLTAVGQDPNFGIYPLAYAIVEAETKDSWSWFLECIRDDLDLPREANYTFISDRQKGIIPAIQTVFPAAEHRFCLRHIHQNMKQQWRGKAFKDCLWDAATSTTVQDFELKMLEFRNYNQEAYDWLAAIPPIHWSRSHFTGRAKNDTLLNNMCECLNALTVDGRDKPIISALEYVREYLMQRIVNVIRVLGKCNGPLTPHATERLAEIKKQAVNYSVKWGGGTKYQVSRRVTSQFSGTRHSQYVVDVVERVCSCREWEVSGIPCRHAVAVNWDMALNGQAVGPPESWVLDCYWLDTWKRVYTHRIEPINGRDMWPKSPCPTTLTPPLHHTPIGRPKKKRRKDQVELQDDAERAGQSSQKKKRNNAQADANDEVDNGGKLTRKWKTVTCKKCGEKGHNSRGCGKQKRGKQAKHARKGKKSKEGKKGNKSKEGTNV